ncbi:MAG: tRNA (adenosine(37)-N6)-threonylcarbamoyltransferase complex dimerization subunit type 1 TsaB [bacterium]
MIILAVETATLTGSVALLGSEDIVIEHTSGSPGTHSVWLMPAIERIFKQAGFSLSDLEAIAVSLGPGSFTGLRVGISTVRGLAQTLRLPVVGIPTLDGLASHSIDTSYRICPILDARKKQVYAAFYRSQKGEIVRISDYLAIEPSHLVDMIQEPVFFLGEGLEVYQAFLKENLGDLAHFAPPTHWRTRALSIASLGLKALERGEGRDFREITPLYIRPPDIRNVSVQPLRHKDTTSILDPGCSILDARFWMLDPGY